MPFINTGRSEQELENKNDKTPSDENEESVTPI
jgi:hypothetical protein